MPYYSFNALENNIDNAKENNKSSGTLQKYIYKQALSCLSVFPFSFVQQKGIEWCVINDRQVRVMPMLV